MTTIFERLVQDIHNGVNPYAGFPLDQYSPDPWAGWDSEHPWFHESIDAVQPRVIVEVGSFKGGSAIHMAQHLKARGTDAAIVCVDTWLAEKVLWTSPQWRPQLLHRFGRPEFYYSFLANVIDAGMQDYIVPLPMDSRAGARFLKHLGISAEMVYVDGSHEAGDVYADLALYFDDILLPGGILLVDDFDPLEPTHLFDGLIHDVQRFEAERGRFFEVDGRKLRMRK